MKNCIKYLWIAYYSAKRSAKYKVNTVLSVISAIIFMSISYHMWSSVYAEQNMDNFLSMSKTLTYVVVIAIINQGICTNVETEIGNRVITGDISLDLIRPISYINYVLFNQIGKIMFNLVFTILPLVIVSITVFGISVQKRASTNIYFIASLILSIFLVFLFEFLLGLVSFITSQIFGVSLMKTAIYNICSGIVIPLSFYPGLFRAIIMNLPFQAMFYGPVSIYCGLGTSNNLLQRLMSNLLHITKFECIQLCEQVAWILILLLLCKIVWGICMRRLVVQGG